MKSRLVRLVGGLTLAGLTSAQALQGQTTTMPSTLRYGSGLMDTPASSVLPHMAVTATLSGFFVDLHRTLEVDDAGRPAGYGPASEAFYGDASLAVGLFDRLEVGTSLQSLGEAGSGGDMWGLFGRIRLLEPEGQGVGLAVGGRYLTAPDFGAGSSHQPGRLGFPDERFRDSYTGRADVSTEVSLYGVASAHVVDLAEGLLLANNMTLSLGYGTGMFRDGSQLGFYQTAGSGGWFFGSALHMGIGDRAVLTFMGEYNGFDVNWGAQLDVNGIRLGAQYLAANYPEPVGGYDSEYRTPKLGIMASVALCPLDGLLCKPELREWTEPDTVRLPAPPPDTVVITREVTRPLPDGTLASVCLATGEGVQVYLTAQGDTLVGPDRNPIRSLRPGVVFAGTYADASDWLAGDEPISLENRRYDKSGGELRVDCRQIVRVGEYLGVPLFARRPADPPFEEILVPVRPGVWQGYRVGPRPPGGQRDVPPAPPL